MRRFFLFVPLFLSMVWCWRLAGAELLLEERFQNPGALENICEGKTVIMGGGASQLILGGPSSTGEQAGIRIPSAVPFDSFRLTLENFNWSHNAPQGGHPTEIRLLNNLKQGYVISIKGAVLALFRQDAPDRRVELARSGELWPQGSGYTVSREFTAERQPDGKWLLQFSGIEPGLQAEDNRYRDMSSVSITYGVYIHGFSANIGAVCLESLDRGGEADADARIVVFDPWGGERPSKMVAAMAGAMRRPDRPVRIMPGSGAPLNPAGIDCLIVPGAALASRDLEPLLNYLREGGKLLLWGPLQWDLGTPAGKRFCERILGVARLPQERECSPLELTPAAGRYAGLSALSNRDFGKLALLNIDNTIEKQSLLPEVETVNLAVASYSDRNWVQLPDRFTGTPLQLTIHRGGEFDGCRVLYAALPLEATDPAFVPVMDALLECVKSAPVTPYVPAGAKSAGLNRRNFFHYPGAVFGTLCFANYAYLDDEIFDEDLDLAGMQVVCYCVPWFFEPQDGEIVDWKRLDEIIAGVERKGKKLMLDPYPFNFNWKAFSWAPDDAVYQPEFEARFLEALREIATRYRDNQTLVAMWCTPYTHSADFAVYRTPENHRLWVDYLRNVKQFSLEELNRRYQLSMKSFDELPFPEEDPALPYNIGPIWSDYMDFHCYSYQNFLRKSIRTIREVIPEMPLTIRSAFMDPALSMAVAAEFPDVATHIECVETSINTEGFYRSYALGFGVPITAENGWPKATPAATRMALADYMMGNYRILAYSFDGPRWARASFPEFRETAYIKRQMAGANYPEAELGLLLPDSTLYSSRPASFFSIEKHPSLELTMERLSYPFVGVSSELPRLDGIKVLLDTGTNRVFSPQLKKALIAFLKAGGTFIGFPDSGAYTRDGSAGFLAELKLPDTPGEYSCGAGKVIVLDDVKNQTPETLQQLFERLKLQRPVTISAPVCNTLLEKGESRFLILFDKRRELVGSFFTESTHAALLEKLQAQNLTIQPNFRFSRVFNAADDTPLAVENGCVKVELPPARFLVLRFE